MKKSKKLLLTLLAGIMLLGTTATVSAAGTIKCPFCGGTGEWVSPKFTSTCNKCGDTISHYECQTAHHTWVDHWH